MSSVKILAMFLILLSVFALWLNANGKLVPVLDEITANPPSGTTVGKFIAAFALYLLVLTLVSPETGWTITIALSITALLVNIESQHSKNKPSLLDTLFSISPTGKI